MGRGEGGGGMKWRRTDFALHLSGVPVDFRVGASSVTSPKQDRKPYSFVASEITVSQLP